MKKLILLLLTAVIVVLAAAQNPAHAANKADIDRDADVALQKLYETTPEARELAKGARGILIFPSIVKGGLIIGGSMATAHFARRERPPAITVVSRSPMACRQACSRSATCSFS